MRSFGDQATAYCAHKTRAVAGHQMRGQPMAKMHRWQEDALRRDYGRPGGRN